MYIFTTLEFPTHNSDFHLTFIYHFYIKRILYQYLVPVYMEASSPGKRDGSVAETNYFLQLYATFHPVYRDEILHWLIRLHWKCEISSSDNKFS